MSVGPTPSPEFQLPPGAVAPGGPQLGPQVDPFQPSLQAQGFPQGPFGIPPQLQSDAFAPQQGANPTAIPNFPAQSQYLPEEQGALPMFKPAPQFGEELGGGQAFPQAPLPQSPQAGPGDLGPATPALAGGLPANLPASAPALTFGEEPPAGLPQVPQQPQAQGPQLPGQPGQAGQGQPEMTDAEFAKIIEQLRAEIAAAQAQGAPNGQPPAGLPQQPPKVQNPFATA
ncbi:MAG: hypothetical protein VKJ04_06490 [Vampirovibrionales bacterium]|nr:hypothetical protein [Vampirovibrionales bacterium]